MRTENQQSTIRAKFRFGPVLALLPLLFLFPSCGLRAQAVRGTVMDAASGEPIHGVSVVLLGSQENPEKGVLTDDEGRFILVAPRTARYRIRLERIGYQTTTGPEIDLLPPDTLAVEMRMSMEAVELAPLTITSERRALVMDTRLASWGFYDRLAHYKRLGSGLTHFLSIEDIKKRSPMRVSDVFRDLAGMRVVQTGGNRVAIRGSMGCEPTFYLDGTELRLDDGEAVDDYLLASSLSAIEVYARPPYPAEYAPRGYKPCASIVIWTGWVKGKE